MRWRFREEEDAGEAILAGNVKLLLNLCSIFLTLFEWLSKLRYSLGLEVVTMFSPPFRVGAS